MRIADVHVGDLVTRAYFSPAYGEPPIKLRVTAIEARLQHSWSQRKMKSDDDPHSWTGCWFVPASLTPYDPARHHWERIQAEVSHYRSFAEGFRAAAARAGLVIPEGAVSHGSAGIRVDLPFEQVRLLTDLFNEVAG